MKTNTTPSTRSWAPAPAISTPRRAGLWLACLTSLALIVPAASAAVSLTPTENEPECVVMSGSWSSGNLPYGGTAGPLPGDISVSIKTSLLFIGFSDFLSVAEITLDIFFFKAVYSFRSDGSAGAIGEGPLDPFWSYDVTGVFNSVDSTWSGTYKITEANCEPTHGVPEGGSALALFACGLGAVGAGRRFMNKRRD